MTVQRGQVISYDTSVPTITGNSPVACCPPLFDIGCEDGSVALFSSGGNAEWLLRWLGLERAESIVEVTNYLQYTGGVKKDTTNTARVGVPGDICAPGDATSIGKVCQYILDCFGLVKTKGDAITDGGNTLKKCKTSPIYTIAMAGAESVRIDNEDIWQEAKVAMTHMNMLGYNLVWGIRDAAPENRNGHYGLWSLLHGYTGLEEGFNFDYGDCVEFTPKVLDWAGNPACAPAPQAGITLNGAAIPDEFTLNIYAALRNEVRQLQSQFAQMEGVGASRLTFGDIAIFAHPDVVECLVKCAVCHLECNGDYTRIMNTDARKMVNEMLASGVPDAAMLNFHGLLVPVYPFDPFVFVEDVNTQITTKVGSFDNGDGTYNMMMLVRGVGSNRVLRPQYNPLDDGSKETRENGFIQTYFDTSDSCKCVSNRSEWRIKNSAPWAQTLIKNVACENIMNGFLVENPEPAVSNC